MHATSTQLSAGARETFRAREWRPLFTGDWKRTVFIHFAVEPEHLQPLIPYPLDLHEGSAYVSLVAFTMDRLRLGPLPEWFCGWFLRFLAPCRFLNVRTYVRAAGTDGIFFLAEWLSNRASVPLGPPLFGLPYRGGRLDYGSTRSTGEVRGRVTSQADNSLFFTGVPLSNDPQPVFVGGLDEFLLERYTAFTEHRGKRRCFRVWHPPWPQTPLELELHSATLLQETGDWCRYARLEGAHFSPGVEDVWMGRPHRLQASL